MKNPVNGTDYGNQDLKLGNSEFLRSCSVKTDPNVVFSSPQALLKGEIRTCRPRGG